MMRSRANLVGAFLFVACVGGWAGSALAQTNLYVDTGVQCYPTDQTQYVWLDPSGFTADGWTNTRVDQLEGTLLRAINVWNEESNSRRTIEYGGRGGPKGRATGPQDTFVVGRPVYSCGPGGYTQYGRATYVYTGTSVCTTLRDLELFLRTCPTFGPSVPTPFAFYWPGATEVSMEAVLIHELGHALFGFDDQYAPNAPRGIMWGTIYPGPIGARLHLYRADQDTAIFGAASGEGIGLTLASTATWLIDSSNSWVGTSPAILGTPVTTFGPSLATRHSNSGYYNSALLLRTTRDVGYRFDLGAPTGWTNLASINDPYLSTAQVQHSWTGAAYSRYDEVTGAWLECNALQPDAGQPDGCVIITNFKSIYQPGASWQEVVHDTPAIARPEVAYDPWTDRFLLVFIHRDGRLWHTFTPAAYSAWSTPAPLGTTDGATRHFRYMGGAVFDYLPPGSSPGAPAGRYGWLFAASSDYRADGVLTPVVQMALQYDSTAGRYVVGVPDLPIPGSSATAFDTVRGFDVGDSIDSNSQLLAFLRVTPSPWQQRIVVARRSSATGPFSTPVQMPWYRSGAISGGVAVSSMADPNNRFVVAVGGEP